jgi:histidinol-phosphate phosphatase family protein
VNNWLNQVDRSWSLFLDRDGVINKRIFGGYITDFSEFEFLPEVLNALVNLSNFFSHVFIVTNQQGVGKGIMTMGQLNNIHEYMREEIRESGGRITEIYTATELSSSDLNHRKPNAYMGLKATQDYPNVDLNRSIMVGDTDSDLLFGKNCGMKVVLQLSEEKCFVEADLVVNNLTELSNAIHQQLK